LRPLEDRAGPRQARPAVIANTASGYSSFARDRALVDWRRLSEGVAAIVGDLAAAHDQTQRPTPRRSGWSPAARLETVALPPRGAAKLARTSSRCSQHIAGEQATIDHERRAAQAGRGSTLHDRNLLAHERQGRRCRSRLKATEAEMAAALAAQRTAAMSFAPRGTSDSTGQRASSGAAGRRVAAPTACRHFTTCGHARQPVESGQTQLAAVQQSVRCSTSGSLPNSPAAKRSSSTYWPRGAEKEQALVDQLGCMAKQIEAAENELTESRNLHASRRKNLAQLTAAAGRRRAGRRARGIRADAGRAWRRE